MEWQLNVSTNCCIREEFGFAETDGQTSRLDIKMYRYLTEYIEPDT